MNTAVVFPVLRLFSVHDRLISRDLRRSGVPRSFQKNFIHVVEELAPLYSLITLALRCHARSTAGLPLDTTPYPPLYIVVGK